MENSFHNFELASRLFEKTISQKDLRTLRLDGTDIADELTVKFEDYRVTTITATGNYLPESAIQESLKEASLLLAPPGSGKTSGIIQYLSKYHEHSRNLFVVPTIALAEAIVEQYGRQIGQSVVLATNMPKMKDHLAELRGGIVVTNYETFSKGLTPPDNADYSAIRFRESFENIIIDEVHKVASDFQFRHVAMLPILEFIRTPYQGLVLMTGTLEDSIKRMFKDYHFIKVNMPSSNAKITVNSVSVSVEASEGSKKVSKASLKDTTMVEVFNRIDPRATTFIVNYSSNKKTFRIGDALNLAPVNAIAMDLAKANLTDYDYIPEVIAGKVLTKFKGIVGSSLIEQGINIPLFDPTFPHAEVIIISSALKFIDRSALIQAVNRIRGASTINVTVISNADQKIAPRRSPLDAVFAMRPAWLKAIGNRSFNSRLTFLQYQLQLLNNYNSTSFFEPLSTDLGWTVKLEDKVFTKSGVLTKFNPSKIEVMMSEEVEVKTQLFEAYVYNTLAKNPLSREKFIASFVLKQPDLDQPGLTKPYPEAVQNRIRPLLSPIMSITLKHNINLYKDFGVKTVPVPRNEEFLRLKALQVVTKKTRKVKPGELLDLNIADYNRHLGAYFAQKLWREFPEDVEKLSSLFISSNDSTGIIPVEDLQSKKFTRDTHINKINTFSPEYRKLFSGLTRTVTLAVLDQILASSRDELKQGSRYFIGFKPFCPVMFSNTVYTELNVPVITHVVQFPREMSAVEMLVDEAILEEPISLKPIPTTADFLCSINPIEKKNGESNTELKVLATSKSNKFSHHMVATWENIKSLVFLTSQSDELNIFNSFQYKNSYRKLENVLTDSQILMFDVDTSTESIHDVHARLVALNLDHVLLTTSNASNFFKYRLVIPSARKVTMKEYKYVIKQASKFLNITSDSLSGSQVMFIYPDSLTLSHTGMSLYVPEKLIVTKLASENKVVVKKAFDVTLKDTRAITMSGNIKNLHIATRYIKELSECPTGERNNQLMIHVGKMKVQGWNAEDALYVFTEVTTAWGVDFYEDKASGIWERYFVSNRAS